MYTVMTGSVALAMRHPNSLLLTLSAPNTQYDILLNPSKLPYFLVYKSTL